MQATTAAEHAARPAMRRLVTGTDAQGRSVIVEDRQCPHITQINGRSDVLLADMWRTTSTPADAGAGDGCDGPAQLLPPTGGTVLRLLQLPPDREWIESVDADAAFGSMASDAHAGQDSTRHAHMHMTPSIDYAIILSGEVWAVMDEGEALMRAGDVLIQRATNHAWSNRSDAPCVIAFMLIDAAGPSAS